MDIKEKKETEIQTTQISRFYLEIPDKVIETLNAKEGSKITIKIKDDGVIIKNELSVRQVVIPLKPVIIASGIVMIAFFGLFMNYKQIPLVGPKSTASLVILFGVLTGMINFTYFFTESKRGKIDSLAKKIYWRNFPTVLISYTLLILVSLLLVFKVLGQLFSGATFDIYTSTIIGTLMVGVINYIMVNTAKTLTPITLIKSLTFIILGGVFVAMLTNQDQQWWLYNFSFLGTPEASNSWQFNITLIFSALIMIALIDYLFVLLYEGQGKSKNLVFLKFLLILTALSLGGVGLFPYNESLFSQTMHNRVAGYLVYLFIVLIIAIRWLLPGISKHFLKISYSAGAALVVAVFLFQGVNYLSLTAFELIAFVLAFSWLLLLLQYLVNLVMSQGNEFNVMVISGEDLTQKTTKE